MGAARKARRKAETQLRVGRREARSNADRMAASERYAASMRAAGYEFDPASKQWLKGRSV